MIITTINDAQQQQQQHSATQHPDGGEEEPGSYVISKLGWGGLRKERVCGLVLIQIEQRSVAIQLNKKYLPKREERRTNQLGKRRRLDLLTETI